MCKEVVITDHKAIRPKQALDWLKVLAPSSTELIFEQSEPPKVTAAYITDEMYSINNIIITHVPNYLLLDLALSPSLRPLISGALSKMSDYSLVILKRMMPLSLS